MNRLTVLFIASLMGTGSSAFAATPSSRMPAEFDVLTRKSIFSNLPGRLANDRGSHHVSTPPPGLPVLVGIIREENKVVAIVEDPATGKVHRLLPGDSLPQNGGIVGDLTLDAMTIKGATEAAAKKIAVGQTITGTAPTFGSSGGWGESSGGVTAGTSDSSAPAASDLPAGGSIEERMRLRRMQQQGGAK